VSPIASVEQIRSAFPALERRVDGIPVAYFDGPGGTQSPRVVADAMTDYLFHHNANTHWQYPSSAETDALIDASRAAVADFLGASPPEIAFGANMTTLTFHLARALGWCWGAGDEVVVTELDHHANIAPWQTLVRERGITLRTVPLDPATGQLQWDALERAVTNRTRLLAIGAASNALGTITDVAGAVALARRVGALTFVDAVHAAPHTLMDVRAIDCDFLSCSAYKFYGPHIGVLYARREVQESLEMPKLAPAPDWPPERLETGTGNHEGIVGAMAAVDFIAALGEGESRRARLESAFAVLHERGQGLVERLWCGLADIPRVTLYGPRPDQPRTPTVAFTVEGMSTDDVARALARRALFLSNGDFYAATVMERLGRGTDGVVRAGAACYTTSDEVDRLVNGVRALV
jgi:cysteine desulfurase family protein (TIGR01976 family)